MLKGKTIDYTDAQVQKDLARVESIFRCNGYDPDKDRQIAIKDALDIPNAAFLIPKVLTQIVQEGVEPMLIGTSLLSRIDYTPGMHSVFPAFDILTAREVGDGAALPIFNINVGGGTTYGVQVKRHGLQLRITERFIENSTYPWMQMWLRLAGNALARHKEEYIFSFIRSLGTVIFDNDKGVRTAGYAGVKPLYGATTGRDSQGRFNGSFTADDLMSMYSQLLMQGFIPDTILVHPLSFMMWLRDSTMREFAIQNGGGSWFNMWTGNAQNQPYAGFYNNKGLGQGLGQSGGNATPESVSQTLTSAPSIPGYYGIGGNLRVLVSPFLRFNSDTKTTDIIMFNSKNLGALIVDEDPHVKSWDEPQYNIQNVAIEETYGFGVLNEGQAIGVARNVKVRANALVEPARSVISIGPDNPNYESATQLYGVASPINVNADRSTEYN